MSERLASPRDGANEHSNTPASVEALVMQVLVGQESLRAELRVLKPSLEPEDQTDVFLRTLDSLTGEEAQLTEAVAEVKEAVTSCGDNWRKNISKLARCTLIINLVGHCISLFLPHSDVDCKYTHAH